MRPLRHTWALAALAAAALACQTVLGPVETVPTPPSRPTPTPPQARPTAAATATRAAELEAGLSRGTPLPGDQPAELPALTVTILETLRGAAAWEQLAQANMFNEPAPEGQEYLLVNLHVEATRGDFPREISDADFKVTGDLRRRYFAAAVVPPEPELRAELRAGEGASGWAAYLIGAGETNLLLMVDLLDNPDETPPYFLTLEPGALVVVDPGLALIPPTDLGTDPAEPAPLGATVVSEDWEVTVRASLRGEEAWVMAQAANQFNEPPLPGMEYIAVQVQVRAIHTDDTLVFVDGYAFKTQDRDGRRYDPPSVVDPEPALDAALFPGGTYQGWVVVQTPLRAPVVLVFQPFLDFDNVNERFLALIPQE